MIVKMNMNKDISEMVKKNREATKPFINHPYAVKMVKK